MSKRRGGTTNYGIQADTVTAGAMAVGEGATAIQTVNNAADPAAIQAALAEFRTALTQAALPPQTQAMLADDVEALAEEAAKPEPQPDRMEGLLKGLVGKVKLAGEFTGAVVELIDPIRKIATAVGIGVGTLGLL